MFCEKCGHKMEDGDLFCTNCGARQTVSAPEMQQEPPIALPLSGENGYCRIIGRHIDYYLAQFEEIRAGGKGRINWASFFLTVLHAAYRGVWKDWLKAVAVPMVLTVVGILLAGLVWGIQWIAAAALMIVAGIGNIWWIVAGILFACRFNRVYFAHVENKMEQGDMTPDPSGGRVVLAIVAYAVVSTLCSGAVRAAWASGFLLGWEQFAGNSTFTAEEQPPQEQEEQPAFCAQEYIGYWLVDSYSGSGKDFIGLQLAGDDTVLGVTVNAAWDQNACITTIDKIPLTLNEDRTQAVGSYRDNRGNSGSVTLDFAEDGLYLTVTASGGDHGITLTREHCSGDAFGAQREYREVKPEPAPQTQTTPQTQTPPSEPAEKTVADPAETLYQYVYDLTDEINAGNFSYVAPTLLHGSTIYTDQKTLVSKLHEQGITETVISVEATEQKVSGGVATVVSNERIGVTYGDGSYKEIVQSFAYHMKLQSDGTWLIDSMVRH